MNRHNRVNGELADLRSAECQILSILALDQRNDCDRRQAARTFEVRDFIPTGVPLTIIAYLLVLVFGATYWKWLGLV